MTQPSLVAGAAALALLAGGRIVSAYPAALSLLWPCPTKAVLGWPCPLCGLTRVVLLLARGDLVGAATLAPLPCALVVGMAAAGVWALAARAAGWAPPEAALARLLRPRAARWSLVVVAASLYGAALWLHATTGAP